VLKTQEIVKKMLKSQKTVEKLLNIVYQQDIVVIILLFEKHPNDLENP